MFKIGAAINIKGFKDVDDFLITFKKQDENDPATLLHVMDEGGKALQEELKKDIIQRYKKFSTQLHPLTQEAYQNPATVLTPKRVWGSTRPFQRSGSLINAIEVAKVRTHKGFKAKYKVHIHPLKQYLDGDPWDKMRQLKIAQVARYLEEGATHYVRLTPAMRAYLARLRVGNTSGDTGQSHRKGDAGATNAQDAGVSALRIQLPARPVWGPAHAAIPGKPLQACLKAMRKSMKKAVRIYASRKTKETIKAR